jgi:DNA-binding CsgD family transcriptional regulator
MTDSRLVHAITSFARAVIDAEPDALLEVSQRFAEMTTWSLAIDAAEAAEQLLAERGENRAAQAVTRTISELRGHCEGLYALDRAADGARLTRRESEIARLAVAGKSTREIAERLFLSSRTVENHLYHVYVKLGVKNRHSLAKVIAPTPEIE